MKAIICDRCGKTEFEDLAATIEYWFGRYTGEPQEQHLCDECRKKLFEWIKGDA